METKTISKFSKKGIKEMWFSAGAMAAVCLFSAQETFGSTFFDSAKSAAKSVYDDLYGILIPVFGLAALICLIVIAVSPGRSFEKAMSWLIRIFIVFIVINCLGWIIALFQDITRGGQLNM